MNLEKIAGLGRVSGEKMAKITVDDGAPVEMDVTPEETVYDLLLKAQAVLWEPHQSIQSMRINGQVIEPLDVDTLQKLPAADATLEVTLVSHDSENRTPLDTLGDTRNYLTHLKTGLEQLAEQIRSNPEPENFKTLSNVMDGISTVLELFDALSGMEEAPEELREDLKNFLGDITSKSEELLEGQESEDATLIADILEYEFMDAVQEMVDLLDRFAELFKEPPQA
jgi:hypothetical protein